MPDKSNSEARTMPIPRFEVGEKVTGLRNKLNQLADAIAVPLQGMNSPMQNTPYASDTGSLAVQLKITANSSRDYLTCTSWDGTTLGTEVVIVAKPYLFQSLKWNGLTRTIGGNVIRLNWTAVDTLTATKVSDSTTEQWKVTMDYAVGDIIYAIGTIQNGLDAYYVDRSTQIFIQLIDLNIDGRAWAKV